MPQNIPPRRCSVIAPTAGLRAEAKADQTAGDLWWMTR